MLYYTGRSSPSRRRRRWLAWCAFDPPLPSRVPLSRDEPPGGPCARNSRPPVCPRNVVLVCFVFVACLSGGGHNIAWGIRKFSQHLSHEAELPRGAFPTAPVQEFTGYRNSQAVPARTVHRLLFAKLLTKSRVAPRTRTKHRNTKKLTTKQHKPKKCI